MSRDRTSLRARNLSDAHLADLLEGEGCPVCRARTTAVARYLDGWLWESVNDAGVRRDLDADRGLCPRHVGALVEADRRRSGSMLGSAILLDAMLRVRLGELQRVSVQHGSRARSRALQEALRSPACSVCRVSVEAERSTVEGIVAQLETPGWADAAADAALCVAHLARLMHAASGSPAWQEVERRQLDRLARLQARLRGFLAHSAYDTRHLRTDDEQAATGKTARALGADEEDR
jgi:hypothetical protein